MDDVDGFRAFEVAPKPEDVLMDPIDNDTIISKSDVVEWKKLTCHNFLILIILWNGTLKVPSNH